MPRNPRLPKAARTYEERPLSPARQAHALLEARPRKPLTRDEVLRETAALALSDISHYQIDDHGEVQLAPKAPPYAMRAVSSIKKTVRFTAEGLPMVTTEITLWNKPAALRLGAQLLKMLAPEQRDGAQAKPMQINVVQYAALQGHRDGEPVARGADDSLEVQSTQLPVPTLYGQRNGH